MESVKHINWRFLQKALTADSRKQISQKVPPWMFKNVLDNTNSYFNESYSS